MRILMFALSWMAIPLFFLASFWLWQQPSSKITKANFERLKSGMTEQEVLAVLKCAPGDYCSDPYRIYLEKPRNQYDLHAAEFCDLSWAGDRGFIQVTFSKRSGRVAETYFNDGGSPTGFTWFEQVADLLSTLQARSKGSR
jgi:hypothetical protein